VKGGIMPYKEFKTEADAKAEVEKIGKPPLGFCPVINTRCIVECVCYCEPKIVPEYIPKEGYRVYTASCVNPMVTGEINVYNQ
jgi:hypothetical protein